MIQSLNEKQLDFVIANRPQCTWRRLAEEFEKRWPGSFKPIHYEHGIGYSQMDGAYLCELAGVE